MRQYYICIDILVNKQLDNWNNNIMYQHTVPPSFATWLSSQPFNVQHHCKKSKTTQQILYHYLIFFVLFHHALPLILHFISNSSSFQFSIGMFFSHWPTRRYWIKMLRCSTVHHKILCLNNIGQHWPIMRSIDRSASTTMNGSRLRDMMCLLTWYMSWFCREQN